MDVLNKGIINSKVKAGKYATVIGAQYGLKEEEVKALIERLTQETLASQDARLTLHREEIKEVVATQVAHLLFAVNNENIRSKNEIIQSVRANFDNLDGNIRAWCFDFKSQLEKNNATDDLLIKKLEEFSGAATVRLQSVIQTLAGIDKQFEKVINNFFGQSKIIYLTNIAEEIAKENPDVDEVVKWCDKILETPAANESERFLAKLYKSIGGDNSREKKEYLRKTDVSKYDIDSLYYVLLFCIKYLTSDIAESVQSLLERAFHERTSAQDTEKYGELNDLFQEENEKVNSGIYDINRSFDVGILYKSEDMPHVLELCKFLEAEKGLKCFYAARNLQHGQGGRYDEKICKALSNCKAIVFISTQLSRNEGDALKMEIPYIKAQDTDNARMHGRTVIDYDTVDINYKKPRIEFVVEKYNESKLTHGDRQIKEFFKGFDRVYITVDHKKCMGKVFDGICKQLADLQNQIMLENAGGGTLNRPVNMPINLKPIGKPVNSAKKSADRDISDIETVAEEIIDKVKAATSVVLVGYSGLTIAENSELRNKCKQAGCEYKIYKTSIIKKALNKLGFAEFDSDLNGPTAVVFGSDDISAANILVTAENDYSGKIIIKSALINNKYFNKNGVEEYVAKAVFADNGAEVEETYPTLENYDKAEFEIEGTVLKKYRGDKAEVRIPQGVTEIGNSAFNCRNFIKFITIPNSVTVIGNNVFFRCSSLAEIEIPNSVKAIGDSAFALCNALTNIIIPNSITAIGTGAFDYCIALENLNIPNKLTKINCSVFKGCKSLTDIFIPRGVEEIGENAFAGCSRIESITVDINNENYKSKGNCLLTKNGITLIFGCKNSVIPKSVKIIDDYAFSGCNQLEILDLSENVTDIGEAAFEYCSGIANITVDVNNKFFKSEGNCLLTKDGNRLILGCKNSVIPKGVVIIGEDAFRGVGLKQIIIPDGVKYIEPGAFYHCSSLTSIDIPESVTEIGDCAFYHCSSLTSIDIPESVTEIGDCAFEDCDSLISVKLPEKFKNDLERIFGENFENISFDWLSSYHTLEYYDKNEFKIADKVLRNYKGNKAEVQIPQGVTEIGGWTFCGCSSLTSVVIPDSVTEIGGWAFANCCSLVSVAIPANVKKIGNNAFVGCSSLTSVTLPKKFRRNVHKIFGEQSKKISFKFE